jgi:AraC-like DNA-binding protein
MPALELILRAFGVIQLTLLATILLRTRRRDQVALVGAALAVSVATFMVTSAPGAATFLGVLIYPLTALCSTHPVWFWLFCVALFTDGFKLTRVHAVILLSVAALGGVYQWISSPDGRLEYPTLEPLLGTAIGAGYLAFVGLGPVAVYVAGRADLDERRRRIRAWFVPIAASYLAVVVIAQLLNVFAARPTPLPLVVSNLAIIDVLALSALLSFVRLRVVNWLDLAEPAPRPEVLSRIEQAALERLHRRFLPERLYAREGLTIGGLAELLDTQEHVLRRVINCGLGFRNFNDFLHSHRLREAAQLLRDPAQARLPVLTIALTVGYGSIGPFNRAFRERFGLTPTEYRRGRDPEPAGPEIPLNRPATTPDA